MKTTKYTTVQEREAYRSGYERGMRNGMKKASMLIQLLASGRIVASGNSK